MKSKRKRKGWVLWAGLLPFLLFVLAFELLPLFTLLPSVFIADGRLTGANFQRALTPFILESFRNSLQLAAVVAGLGVVLGTIVAYAMVTTRNQSLRNALTALADVTTNFGGAPLAFAFIITLGSTGIVTLLLKAVGIHLYPTFRVYSIVGLAVAYLYFELPLMILVIIPALLGLRREWREAAVNLGASNLKYWTRVGLPILAPSLLSGFLLLFANAFGAYATAWTLTGPDVNLVTVQIAALVRGEVQLDPSLADTLAIISLLVMALCVAGYQLLNVRTQRSRT
ncbi:MAG: ABC transporter permease subunit [Anaerolineae bacterium]|nr:ABC transporter permease subunit [Anaerolineae bacterium]